jgi:hypothetical protein
MTDVLTKDMLVSFKSITSYDLTPFFTDYISFTDDHYPAIADFYTNVSKVYPTESFKLLNSLLTTGKYIESIMRNSANSLAAYQYWIIAEQVDDINGSLATANNASRWLRSSITSNARVQGVQVNYMAKQGQGLEDIEQDVLKSDDPENDWAETAISNDLREEDYTLSGGYLIKVIYNNSASINITTIVDNIDTSDKTYGLDINRQLTWVNSDIQVLSYRDTIVQSAKILAGLVQGDNPTFPLYGFSRNFVGSNLAAVAYPTMFRQLAGLFATDDSFKNFAILDISRSQDSIAVKFQVESRAGEVFNEIIQL